MTPLPVPMALDGETHAAILPRAVQAGMVWRPNTVLGFIGDHDVFLVDTLSRETETMPGVDTVVIRTHGLPEDSLYRALEGKVPELELIGPFYGEPGFAEAWRDVAREPLAAFRADHVLFSFHGLPERQIRKSDPTGAHCLASAGCCDAVGSANARCYRAHCFATSRALAAALGLPADRCTTAFQSRLGRTPWIAPYTDHELAALAARGARRLAVLCPSFVADCLETLEEIGIRAREQWHSLGGEALELVPCANADPAWARTVADWIRERA